MKKYISLTSLILWVWAALAQSPTTVILNGTIHVGNGQVIEKGVLVFEGNKIVEVGKEMKTLYKNARVIDAQGKHVYPGLICMNNIMGLNEIDAVRATLDFNEQGRINPNVRSLVAYNTDSKILPTSLINGILFTQPVPQGGLLSGTSCVMRTKAWNWEDAAVSSNDGVHLNWPFVEPNQEGKENQGEKDIQELEQFFAQAKQYCSQKTPEFNAKLDAMRHLFLGEINLYIHAQDAQSIVRSVSFFKAKYPELKLVLVGARESYLITDFIKSNGVPVVLGNLHRLPAYNAEDIDQPYKTPFQLQTAGITFAISQEGSWETRNLAFLAGTAAAYGLSKEQALMAITLTPAKLMSVDNQIGSLEVGKNASILISEGDLLDMKTCVLVQAFLDGQELDLKNEQVQLYEKYKKKYGLK
jgi:imidazolonepropionase-like amidohydrolase